MIEHYPNRGKGAAVRAGLLAATHPIGLFSDADLSTPIDEAPKLVEPIAAGEVDIAFGSRALDRRLIGNHQPWRREQGGRVFNLVVRVATGLPFWDTQCGFKAFRLDVCRPILEKAQTDGFGFDVELLYLALARETQNAGDSGALEPLRRKQSQLLPRQPAHVWRSDRIAIAQLRQGHHDIERRNARSTYCRSISSANCEKK